jgi:23S rRNA (pseudouridine1915-N3)-methyltransferase
MTIKLLAIGKTDQKELTSLIAQYEKRLSHYVKFEMQLLPDIRNSKNMTRSRLLDMEATLFMKAIKPTDVLFLLDERGKLLTSEGFATFLQKQMNSGIKQLVLAIGGPYGFGEDVYIRANGQLSLSKMTFSHQMVRLFVVEQIYRAYTILGNEPYHHR